MRTCLAVCLDEQNKLQPFTTPLHQLEEIFKLSIPISTILFIVIIGRFQLISLLQENDDALHPSLCSSSTSLHLGGLIYWSKGLRFGGLQLSIDKKKYISNISTEALPLHNSIGPAAANLIQEHFIWHTSQNYKQQMKLYLSTNIYIGVLLYPTVAAPMHHQVMASPHIF